jgi:hypothetical protein
VNNNIHITRGETATYDVKLIDKATGAPFILPTTHWVDGTEVDTNTTHKFVLMFGVRRSDYVKDGYAIRKFLWLCGSDSDISDKPEYIKCNDIVLLDDTEIEEYKDTIWLDSNPPKDLTRKILYKRKLDTGGYDYRYWNADSAYTDSTGTTHWTPYSFTIRFPFFYSDTATLSPKSYKYAMTIYGGSTLSFDENNKIDERTITYKKPLVDAQFIVEADINE